MQLNGKSVFLLIVVSSVVIVTILELTINKNTWKTASIYHSPDSEVTNLIGRNITSDNIKEVGDSIVGIVKWLRVAELHARGAKTTRALKQAKLGADTLLKRFGTSYVEVTRRKVFNSKNVCPEYYLNNHFDFPLFELGYVVKNCTYATPLEKLVTVILIDNGSNNGIVETVLSGLLGYLKYMPVVLGTYGEYLPKGRNIQIIKFPKDATEGNALNTLIANVKTEYTLIARDVIDMNYDARIDRLVREIERLDVPVVGGSIRNSDSLWNMACHQRAFKNFTVVYQEGYDESIHDCVLCDHVDGPFLIRTATLMKVKFDGKITPMGLYEDFFMRIESEVVVCPDSMFYVASPKRTANIASWEAFGRKRNLYKLKFSSGPIVHFGCNYLYPCTKVKGFVRSPCCIQELADAKNNVMKMCEESGILCELQAGSLLGAVKLKTALSWEIDGDLRFWYQNYTALRDAGKSLNKKGYRFVVMQSMGKCNITSKRMTRAGFFYVYTKHWFVELYSFCGLDSYDLLSRNRNRTKVLHNGYPAFGTRNPSLVTRNRYPQFYSHVQHFREGGVWNVHVFSKCPVKGRHDCIDEYNVDGNIQFGDPVP